jgi:predicted GNAT superfamily acetyltransferase
VREDARRLERASRLVASIETECVAKSLPMLRCRVASDIDANAFWTAIGYEAVGETTSTWLNTKESKSKRKLTVYHKPLLPRLFDGRTT